MPTRARRIALEFLLRLEQPGCPTLADWLARPTVEALPERDRGFLHELLLGTLRRRGALDHSLRPLLSRPLEQLDAVARSALRLGAYQILHMRLPARAAVSESVSLAKEGAPRSASLVNAVLRRLAREGPAPDPNPDLSPRSWLTATGSLPDWLAERWTDRLGPEQTVARARALLNKPAAVGRLNPRLSHDQQSGLIARLSAHPLIVPGSLRFGASPAPALSQTGQIYLQDQGAQLVAHLAAGAGRRLDACAAPGGKALLMGDLAGARGRVVAAEISLRRLSVLSGLVRRWGSPNVMCVGADALRPPFRSAFDAVLLDAPCSGLGTLGRNPDIRWRLKPQDLLRQARRQSALIHALAGLVRPGGLLVYSTCSTEPEESDDIVREFLRQRVEFAPEAPPAWAAGFVEGDFVRTRPQRDDADAFFVALLRRRSVPREL